MLKCPSTLTTAGVFGAAFSSLAVSMAVAVSVPSLGWTIKIANEIHPKKAKPPMVVIDFSRAMLTNSLYPEKAYAPMAMTKARRVKLSLHTPSAGDRLADILLCSFTKSFCTRGIHVGECSSGGIVSIKMLLF